MKRNGSSQSTILELMPVGLLRSQYSPAIGPYGQHYGKIHGKSWTQSHFTAQGWVSEAFLRETSKMSLAPNSMLIVAISCTSPDDMSISKN